MNGLSPDVQHSTSDSPSKVHMWMFIFLGWTAVFSLLSVGLLLTKSSDSGLSTTELSAACQNGVLNGITTNLTRISEACSNTESTASTAPTTVEMSIDNVPTFSYPLGWHFSIYHDVAGNKNTTTLRGSADPLISGTNTHAPFSPFLLVAGHKADLPMAEFPNATETNGNVTVTVLENGTLTTVTNVINDITGELEEFIYFVGQTDAVKITLQDSSKRSVQQNADIAIIVNSLDFSEIQ